MKTSTKILGMTAAVAILSAPALAAETVKVKVGETVTYETKDIALPGDEVVGYEIEAQQEFARIDSDNNGSVTRKEFYKNVMLDEEAEIFALFDTNQSGDISPEEFSTNSRYGNAEVTNKITNNTKSNANFGSMREKYYAPKTTEAQTIEPASGTLETSVDAGIDYNGIDEEPAVNAGIDYKGDINTPKSVKAVTSYN